MNKLLFKPLIFVIFLSFLIPGLFSKKSKKAKKENALLNTVATDSTETASDSLLNQGKGLADILYHKAI